MVAPPPTIEPGTPVSACQRRPSLRSGITSTRSPAASRSPAKAACQPAGSGVTSATGTGRGIRGRMASTATAVASSPISRRRPTRDRQSVRPVQGEREQGPGRPVREDRQPVREQVGQQRQVLQPVPRQE